MTANLQLLGDSLGVLGDRPGTRAAIRPKLARSSSRNGGMASEAGLRREANWSVLSTEAPVAASLHDLKEEPFLKILRTEVPNPVPELADIRGQK